MSSSLFDFAFVGLLYIYTLHLLVQACLPVVPSTTITSSSSSTSTSTQLTTTTTRGPCSFSSLLDINSLMNFNGNCTNGQCQITSGSTFSVQGSVCGNDGQQISTTDETNQQIIASGSISFDCTNGLLTPTVNGVANRAINGDDVTTINCFPTCSLSCDTGSARSCPFLFQGMNDATCSGNVCMLSDQGTTRIVLGTPAAGAPLCNNGDEVVFTVVDSNGVRSGFVGTVPIDGTVERGILFCNEGWLTAAYVAGVLESVPGDIVSIGCQ